jgi:hypothetical protein
MSGGIPPEKRAITGAAAVFLLDKDVQRGNRVPVAVNVVAQRANATGTSRLQYLCQQPDADHHESGGISARQGNRSRSRT